MQRNASSLLNIIRNFAKYPCYKSAERLRNIWNKEVVSIYFLIGLIFLSGGLTQFLLYKKQLLHISIFLSSYICFFLPLWCGGIKIKLYILILDIFSNLVKIFPSLLVWLCHYQNVPRLQRCHY